MSLQACGRSTGIMAASLSCFEEINKLGDKVLSVVRGDLGRRAAFLLSVEMQLLWRAG